MKIWISVLLLAAAPLPLFASENKLASQDTIWFDSQATNFTESTPLGNGRLGAMMFGGVNDERIVLNESSVWSGSPQDADRKDAYKALPEIRQLLLDGKNVEAEALINKNFTCKGPGSANGTGESQYGCYQVLGNLHLAFSGATNASVENYRRELSLDDAVARMEFSRDGVTFKREMFVSAPDQVMVLRLTASKPKRISFEALLDRPERFETTAEGNNGLLMSGQLDNGLGAGGVRYVARVHALNRGGQVSTHGNILSVSSANEVILLIAAGTDYQGFAGRETRDPIASTLDDLKKAAKTSYAVLRKGHIADYQKHFQRVSLYLKPADSAAAMKPTPERAWIAKNDSGDPNLAALYFNFGRYLLISSSRPGGLPPNLQGIWAEEIHTPWTGDWHLDINVEMNYWPAEVCNLSDLTQPLFALIASLQKPGEKTAHDYYDADGWVAHVITNPWGFTSPGEGASWGSTTCGSGWLCQHLWDHYLFTRDTNFLEWAYPIMKGAAEFYSASLIEDPKHHWIVMAPSISSENHYELPDGQQPAVSLGSTFQSEVTRYLFTACIESSRILGVDQDFREKLISQRAKLMPIQIGPDGRVMEWPEPYKEADPHHRHISHLWSLYPGNDISVVTTPALASAARKTLAARGDDSLGWSYAFKALLSARLGDAEHAWNLVRDALNPVVTQEVHYDKGGGIYPNMFDAAPPFQIDANFGLPAAIAEMLLQSQDGVIHLLPALPDEWKEGYFSGLCARGGFEVGATWKNGQLITAVIRSKAGEPCRVRYGDKTMDLKIKKYESVKLDRNLIELSKK